MFNSKVVNKNILPHFIVICTKTNKQVLPAERIWWGSSCSFPTHFAVGWRMGTYSRWARAWSPCIHRTSSWNPACRLQIFNVWNCLFAANIQNRYSLLNTLKPSANGSTSFSQICKFWKKKCFHWQKALIYVARYS